MRPRNFCAMLVWIPLAGPAARANSPPVVSHVTASQRSDGSGLVDIHYDLADADGDSSTISMAASNNGGQTWAIPALTFTGAIGFGITPGMNKSIVWDCKTDLPGQISTLEVQVCANVTPAGMSPIPAGEFQMGDVVGDAGAGSWELPVHTVYVNNFYMDQTLVTNQQYVDALIWAKAQGNLIAVTNGAVTSANGAFGYLSTLSADGGASSRITWDGNTFGILPGKETHPVILVSFYGSAAYANWRSAMQGKPLAYNTSNWTCNFAINGYRLPTEAEWEKAARGGGVGHRFPWTDTDTIQQTRANYASTATIPYDTSLTRGFHPTFVAEGYPYTNEVAYFAANGYGLYDMAGNVWERCNDWFSATYYSVSPYNNPTGPASGTNIAVRGGAWHANATSVRCSSRDDGIGPNYRANNIGFRCALGGPTGTGGGCANSGAFSVYNYNADLDLDGDVDMSDFGIFQRCLTPAGQTLTPGCANADLNVDNLVTQADLSLFLLCLNGADQARGCN